MHSFGGVVSMQISHATENESRIYQFSSYKYLKQFCGVLREIVLIIHRVKMESCYSSSLMLMGKGILLSKTGPAGPPGPTGEKPDIVDTLDRKECMDFLELAERMDIRYCQGHLAPQGPERQKGDRGQAGMSSCPGLPGLNEGKEKKRKVWILTLTAWRINHLCDHIRIFMCTVY